MHRAFILTVCLLASVTGEADAAILSGDLYAPRDRLLTIDTDTGLQWANPPVGAGFTLRDFVNGTTGLDKLGFRLAAEGANDNVSTEVNRLLADAGSDCIPYYSCAVCFPVPQFNFNCDQTYTAANAAAEAILLSTGWLQPSIFGVVATPLTANISWDAMPGFLFVGPGPSIRLEPIALLALHYESSLMEIALVRDSPVPIPAGFWLFPSALGLLGLRRGFFFCRDEGNGPAWI